MSLKNVLLLAASFGLAAAAPLEAPEANLESRQSCSSQWYVDAIATG
jgi:hypothetical protein